MYVVLNVCCTVLYYSGGAGAGSTVLTRSGSALR
jgi:hypothetical protein